MLVIFSKTMKYGKATQLLIAVAVVFVSLAVIQKDSLAVINEVNGFVSFETEDFDTNTPYSGYSWTFHDSSAVFNGYPVNRNYSGTGFMRIEPIRGAQFGWTASPEMTYTINFTNTGTYYVWWRGYFYNSSLDPLAGNSDSFLIGVDGTQQAVPGICMNEESRGGLDPRETFVWKNKDQFPASLTTCTVPMITIDSPGIHTIAIKARESLTIIDAITLTKDPAFNPNTPPTPTPTPTPAPTLMPTPTPTPIPTPVLNTCGNGIIEGLEQCDGNNLNGQTCASLGVLGGGSVLSCNSNCTFNISGCIVEPTPIPTDPTEPPGAQSVSGPWGIINPLRGGTRDITGIILLIADWIFNIAGSLIVILILYAGLRFMLSRGNPGEIQKAKAILQWALIGFFVVAIGKGFITLLEDILIRG